MCFFLPLVLVLALAWVLVQVQIQVHVQIQIQGSLLYFEVLDQPRIVLLVFPKILTQLVELLVYRMTPCVLFQEGMDELPLLFQHIYHLLLSLQERIDDLLVGLLLGV